MTKRYLRTGEAATYLGIGQSTLERKRMRSIERRLRALEKERSPSDEGRLDLDALSLAQLDRLEELLLAREAGEWSEVSELADADLRLLASIPVR